MLETDSLWDHPDKKLWCLGPESNRRRKDFQSFALPAELPRHGPARRSLGVGWWAIQDSNLGPRHYQ